jgi:hypothetical protein
MDAGRTRDGCSPSGPMVVWMNQGDETAIGQGTRHLCYISQSPHVSCPYVFRPSDLLQPVAGAVPAEEAAD